MHPDSLSACDVDCAQIFWLAHLTWPPIQSLETKQMQTVKRVEIITGPTEFRLMVGEMEKHGVTGYAVIRNVLGKGDKKVHNWDTLTSEVENLLIVTTIPEHKLSTLVEAIRPILKRFGGSCLVSDAMWVIH